MKKFVVMMMVNMGMMLLCTTLMVVVPDENRDNSMIYLILQAIYYCFCRLQEVLVFLFFFKFKRVEIQMQMQHLSPETIVEELKKCQTKVKLMFACILLLDVAHVGLLFIHEFNYFEDKENSTLVVANILQITIRAIVYLFFAYLTICFLRMTLRYANNLGLMRTRNDKFKIVSISVAIALILLV